MGIVDEVRKKTAVGTDMTIGAASTQGPFDTVIAEAEQLEKQGLIQILVKGPDRIRFKRLK